MRPELAYLAASSVLYLLMVLAQGALRNLENDPKTLLGPRDGVVDKGVRLQRASRALRNMNEAMHMFAPLAVVVVMTGAANGVSALGAALFFWARVAFAPLYVLGISTVRSIAWAIGVVGVLMTGWPLLPF
ncbi:MAG: MAPEG family protein [Parvularculaceae bacterium]